MMRRIAIVTTLLLTLVASDSSRLRAQEARPGARGRERLAGPQDGARQQLEQQFRRGIARVVKQRVGLDDAQMARLSPASTQFERRRRSLLQEERARRQELRAQMQAGPAADQNRVASALDRLLQLQRDRLDLQIEEQREYGKFMTPLQRARYFALQEQLRRRLEGLRRARSDTSTGTELPDRP